MKQKKQKGNLIIQFSEKAKFKWHLFVYQYFQSQY